ncbi:hypothetical protein AB2B41_00030 [Marimonas sp. MJW-29]|uniref:Uncharacterized protein n=1 Tax=Sulfitobacter sediminis TaxID=3234186 RepID=A0ABV3RG77_9RHOB
MALAEARQSASLFAEDIRLVIWDLDETFWDGTLTEGGISYRMDHHALVVELAKRGILSAICSKNDLAPVEALLRDKGLWDYFVFPSIDWTPKGPRIQQMLAQIGLRPASVLFLDDNSMNLAQAAHMNPGLNTGAPALIAQLSDAPQLQGKADTELTRLAQYKVKERKAEAAQTLGGDTVAFLRQSNVRVFIDHDVEAHLDRAIELINRTNQLNFTKNRLPDDMEAARRDLLALLSHNTTDAGLIRVRDDYGDYGFVGFYLTRRLNNARRLEHFCFSCRTLNMFIEHWTYDFLGRPVLTPIGEVLSDPTDPDVVVDWITPAPIEAMASDAPAPVLRFDRVFARGGCDLASLMHYFTLHTGHLVEEFNQPQNGQMLRRDHTAFLTPALGGGLTGDQLRAAEALGYSALDFESALGSIAAGRPLIFLSFWADADIPVYRHRESGLRVPYWLVGAQNHDLIARQDLREAVARTDEQRKRLETLCADFVHEGLLGEDEMRQRYARILDAMPPGSTVVLMLANERGPMHYQLPDRPLHPHHARLNRILREIAQGRERVILVDPADHISGPSDLIDLNHFKRPVYHRLYRDILGRLTELSEAEAEGPEHE